MIVIHKIPWRWASNTSGKGPWIPQLSWGVQIASRSPRPRLQVFSGRFKGEHEGNAEEALGGNDSVIKKIWLMNFPLYKHEETNTGRKTK